MARNKTQPLSFRVSLLPQLRLIAALRNISPGREGSCTYPGHRFPVPECLRSTCFFQILIAARPAGARQWRDVTIHIPHPLSTLRAFARARATWKRSQGSEMHPKSIASFSTTVTTVAKPQCSIRQACVGHLRFTGSCVRRCGYSGE